MISLRKTATELDRLEELHRTAVNCYAQALQSSGQNAIELDATQAAHFRSQLQALRDKLQAGADARELASVQSGFDAELKDYCEKGNAQLKRLRKDVEAASAAMEAFASSVTQSELLLDAGIKRQLNQLNQTAASDNIEEIRGAIHTATAKIAASVDQMRTDNQLSIAQLKDEIRLLHQEVQAARRSKTTPPPDAKPAEAAAPPAVDSRIAELVGKNSTFSVLLVVVRNLEGLGNVYSPAVLDTAIRNFQSRFETIFPPPAMVGRWAKDQFAAILETPSSDVMDMSREVVRRLSTPFIENEQGATHSIVFTPRAGVIEFRPGQDMAKFQAKLKQLADALAG